MLLAEALHVGVELFGGLVWQVAVLGAQVRPHARQLARRRVVGHRVEICQRDLQRVGDAAELVGGGRQNQAGLHATQQAIVDAGQGFELGQAQSGLGPLGLDECAETLGLVFVHWVFSFYTHCLTSTAQMQYLVDHSTTVQQTSVRYHGHMDALFAQGDLPAALEHRARQVVAAVEKIDDERLLQTSEQTLIEEVVKDLTVELLELDEDGITVDQRGVKVSYNDMFDRTGTVPGTEVTYFVPFTGDAELWKCSASQRFMRYPHARIGAGELTITVTRTDHDETAVRAAFEEQMDLIRKTLVFQRNDIEPFNASLPAKARSAITNRREKLLKDRGMVAGLGFPLRERPGAARTHVAPKVRRKVKRPETRPKATAPFKPEPGLAQDDYEHIIDVMRNMVHVIERSPATFATLDEEALRTHFLVQLNGQYEGQATGETFNFEGKTDILIRVDGRNIFIAECKFWKGPKGLTDTIDQLLGYTSWRDTKTAIVLFNRDRELSTVLGKVPDTVQAHPNYVRDGAPARSETEFRYVLHHRDDALRELDVSVLVFEVPGATPAK